MNEDVFVTPRDYEAIMRELTYGPNPPTADDYTYRVDWDDDSFSFRATVDEFPSLSWVDASLQVAADSLRGVVEKHLEDMMDRLEEIPRGAYAK
ncbi:hypothetical protein [Tsukamurella paurometabola]|uniref:Uncharacterized protein n=1 Tax=Tsukamurella paurometabola TaxID=2061 RepID=A0ABS5NE03_TSUPA|nr:hypothetical protein [Tsukamurella paurometabola]MBS4102463.1 hypothetical protein [Tsukamurella paurometabola]